MTTVVIFDEMDASLKFFTVEGDYSRFNRFYINSTATPEDLQQEMVDFLYHPEGHSKHGYLMHETTEEFPVDAVRNGAQVVVIGFLP